MEGYPTAFGPRPYSTATTNAPFKIDEGYSEDTRSQDDEDSALGIEPRLGEPMTMAPPSNAGLPENVLTLSEAERSGIVLQGTFEECY